MNIFLKQRVDQLGHKGLKRGLRKVESSQSTRISIDGKELLNFCSNNYLGLADDTRLKQAAIDAVNEYGFGSGASRLVCGNMSLHQHLEQKLSDFKKTEASLIFSTGYMANVGIIASFCDRHDVIFSDKLNHASIIDGIALSRATLKRYAHCDMQSLEELLQTTPSNGKKIIITDTVFSMDGDVAPLKEIVSLAKKYNAYVMVDEAHGLGVLGKNGGGLVEQLELQDDIDIQMGTFSKAAGSFGAYCCGSKELIDFLINHARSFIYTTAQPVSTAAVTLKAIEIIEQDHDRREMLHNNANYMRDELHRLGFDTANSTTPIIPIMLYDTQKAIEYCKALFDNGIFIQAIRTPTVPVNTDRLRLTVMVTHTKDDLDQCLEGIKNVM